MGALINTRLLRQMIEAETKGADQRTGIAFAVKHIRESLTAGDLKCDDFSIRSLAEGLVGREWVESLSRGQSLMEATNAVDTAAFANITGQLIFSKVIERYNDPSLLYPNLCTSTPSTFLDGEKIPGIGRIGNKTSRVGQGDPYPLVGLSEEYVETIPMVKRGFIVPLTREVIIADRTGLLLRVAGEGAYAQAIDLENRVIDVLVGTTNNYKRNGTTGNTYLTSGAYINKIASGNALENWKNVEAVELLFDAITDPNTGEPIDVLPDTLIVPSALAHTARRIVNATSVAEVDNSTSTTSVRAFSANPLNNYTIVSGPKIKSRSTSATKFWLGQPKRAITRLYAWDIETQQSSNNDEAAFTQDIVQRFKVSVMDSVTMTEPRYLCQSDA